MATLTSLAPELVDCIGQFCELQELQNLRLTCRYIAEQLEANVFRNMSFDVHRNNIEGPVSRIRFLARNPDCAVSRAVHHLNLGSLSPKHDTTHGETFGTFYDSLVPYPTPPFSPRILMAEEDIKMYLSDALSCLKNVQTVSWQTSPADEEWAQTVVLDALRSYQNLRRLDISLAHARISIPLHLFTTLREISLDEHAESADDTFNAETILNLARMLSLSPPGQLTHLSVNREWQGTRTTKALSLRDLFQFYPPLPDAPPLRLKHLDLQNCFVRLDDSLLPHFRHLTSLHLYHILEPCREPIVRGYRGMFSKLSAINDEVMRAQIAVGARLDEFWDTLSREELFLEEIRLNQVVPRFLRYLMRYSGLKRLSVSTNLFLTGVESDVVARQFFSVPLATHKDSLEELVINATYEGLWCFGEHNVENFAHLEKLRVLSVAISSADLPLTVSRDVPGSKKDVIKLLLDTCAIRLPTVRRLILRPAILESYRGSKIGQRSYAHLNLVQSRIVTRLDGYRAPRGCKGLPVVVVWNQEFSPVCTADDEILGGNECEAGVWRYPVGPEDRMWITSN